MARRFPRTTHIRRRLPFAALLPPWLRAKRSRDRDRDKDDGGVPVEPNNPKNLTGGAAAELEFDD